MKTETNKTWETAAKAQHERAWLSAKAAFGFNPSPEARALLDDLLVACISEGLAQILQTVEATPGLDKAKFVSKFEALETQILTTCAISDPLVCMRSIQQLFVDFNAQSIPQRKDTYAVQNPSDFGKPESTEQQYQLKVRVVERRVGADLHFEYTAAGCKSARYSVRHIPGVRVGDRVRVCVNDSLGHKVFLTIAPGVFVECVPTIVNEYGFFVDAPIFGEAKIKDNLLPTEVLDVLARYGIPFTSVSAVSGA